MIDAVVAGHLCLDITPKFLNQPVNSFSEVVSPGGLVEVGAADVHLGGCVANTGLAMQKLGASVCLMGKLGLDTFGDMAMASLHTYQADTSYMRQTEGTTSYSVVLSPAGIDRAFLHHPGVNNTFREDDLNFSKIKDARLFHFGYPSLMRRFYENDGTLLEKIFRKVKEGGTATSMDMAAIDDASEAGGVDWTNILAHTLPCVDFFVPSIEELAYMLDRPRYDSWLAQANGRAIPEILNVERDIVPLAKHLVEMGAKIVLVKCGALGMLLYTADKARLENLSSLLCPNEWANQIHFEPSFVPERIISATGAGDTSIAAFLCSVLNGYGWLECVRYATATGACCLAGYDALSGLLPFSQLKEKITAGWRKNGAAWQQNGK